MKILKFGGSSVGTPERIQGVIKIIAAAEKQGRVAVVVSAFQGVTDQLVEVAKKASAGDGSYRTKLDELVERHREAMRRLVTEERQGVVLEAIEKMLRESEVELANISRKKELFAQALDAVMSFGERFSAYIVSAALKSQGIDAEYLDSRGVLKTDDNFGSGRVDFASTYRNIQKHFSAYPALQVITGFIGSTASGETTTLGRGGSDYTASIFGTALDATEIEIWTDVDGVLTADPKKVPNAFPIPQMTYEEAMEMSHFGAKVLYPPTIQPAREKNISIRIKNTFRPDSPGTLISDQPPPRTFPATGLSSISNIALLRLEGSGMIGVAGIAARLFGALAQKKISVILITQASSEHSISFAILPAHVAEAKKAIEEEFEPEIRSRQIEGVVADENRSIVALVGENMRRTPGIAARLFGALGKERINIEAIAQGSSELNISVVVDGKDEVRALNVMHNAFFNVERPDFNSMKSDLPGRSDFDTLGPIHIFLVGTGLVGSELLKQIADRNEHRGPRIKIAGLMNSKKMLLNSDGVLPADSRSALEGTPATADLELFVRRIKEQRLPQSVFVDCTASDEVVSFYPEILRAGISIVTPNKKGNAGKPALYKEVRQAAKSSGAKFCYDTNVGAGLPILRTIRDLLASGDEVLKIEGVLSGTLSYIFNTFDGQKPFSAVVREAKEKGYTEPDPRDDLNGLDVGRKLLILAREIGWPLEFEDVSIENLVPANAREARSLEDFWQELEKSDSYFAVKQKAAAEENRWLRYIGVLENGRANVSLEAVAEQHPFYSLSGPDNIVTITTKCYHKHPIVIRGPGAGAEVTASGILADILRSPTS